MIRLIKSSFEAAINGLLEIKKSRREESLKQLNTDKPILCFNFSNVNFDKAFGVPNFVYSWLPHLVRHHHKKYHLRYYYEGELPPKLAELVDFNKVLPIRDGQKFLQFNFSHFQNRLKGCVWIMTFVHDLHALTIPWKYNKSNYNRLIDNIVYSDRVVSYFPYTQQISKVFHPNKFIKVPQFPIIDYDEHGPSSIAESLYKDDGIKLFYPSDCQVHKNHYTLLKGLALLKKNHSGVKLVLTGFNEEEDHCQKIKSLIDELGLTDNVFWHGALSEIDIIELYRACDVVVQPSLAEGGAMVAVEGAFFRKPVCVADIPQCRTALKELGIYAHWFEPLSERGLSAAVESAIRSSKSIDYDYLSFCDNRDGAAKIVSESWADV